MPKIEEIAVLYFYFKNISTKADSYVKLKKFLTVNGYLNENECNIMPLYTKNTYDDGKCRVILLKDTDEAIFKDEVNEFYDILKNDDDVTQVNIDFNKYTEDIYYNNFDNYQKHITKDSTEIVYGDEIIVYVKS